MPNVLFEFVGDRAPQGAISGPFKPIADQTKFVSIYGVVNGPQIGPFTGQQIEDGQIYSADGKARMGGIPVKTSDGKFHDVQSGSTTFREFKVPISVHKKWNAYEAHQSNQQCQAISERGFGENVKPTEFKEWNETEDAQEIAYEKQPAAVVQGAEIGPKPKRQLTEEQKEKLRQNIAKAREKRAAKSTQPTTTT